MDQSKTGKFIAEMLKEKKLTQKDLAEKLLISDKTVSKWECVYGDALGKNALYEVSQMRKEKLAQKGCKRRLKIIKALNLTAVTKRQLPFLSIYSKKKITTQHYYITKIIDHNL